MLDKIKAIMDMQKKAQDIRRELENVSFEASSSDGLVGIVMSGSQEVKEVRILADLGAVEKGPLEKSLKDAYNRAIRRSHDIAREKMEQVTGLSIPGLL